MSEPQKKADELAVLAFEAAISKADSLATLRTRHGVDLTDKSAFSFTRGLRCGLKIAIACVQADRSHQGGDLRTPAQILQECLETLKDI